MDHGGPTKPDKGLSQRVALPLETQVILRRGQTGGLSRALHWAHLMLQGQIPVPLALA